MQIELNRVFDALPSMVWTATPDGNIDFINGRWSDYVGLRGDGTSEGWQAAIDPDDLPHLLERWRDVVATGTNGELKARVRRFDGENREFHIQCTPLRDDAGGVIKWFGVATDVEDARQTEARLAIAERRLQLTIDTIPVFVATYEPDGRRSFVNRTWREYMGLSAEEATGAIATSSPHIHPGDSERIERAWRISLASGEPLAIQVRVRRADGEYRWHLVRRVPLRDESQDIVRWYSVGVDIEDQKRAEEALRAKEVDLRKVIDTIPALSWSARMDGSVDFLNQHYVNYTGIPLDQLLDWRWTVAIHPDDINGLKTTWRTVMDTGQAGEAEARLRRHDGVYRWFLFRSTGLRDEAGNVVKWYGFNIDIEDRKRAEQALSASERNLQLIIDTIPTTAWSTRPDGYCEFLNHRWLDYAGFTSEQAQGWGWSAAIHPDDAKALVDHWQGCLESGAPVDTEARMRRFDGEYRWFLFRANPLRDDEGKITKWFGTNVDIEDRKRADNELRRSEAFLADAQRLSRTGSFSWQVTTNQFEWSEETYRIHGLDPDADLTLDLIRTRIHPDDLPVTEEVWDKACRQRGDFDYETRLVMPDRSIKYLHVVAHSDRNNDGGLELRGAIQDVTERHLADEALSKARSDLTHVARVTSLGALTASIAHEVNQPLSGIVTNASTCLRMLAADPPNIDGAQETARRTIRDGNRAAEVITRLRALFSKRAVKFQDVDLNEAAREVIALASSDLQRSRIFVRTELEDGLPIVSGDRVQLQQVIMNLLRNAADSMSSTDDRPRKIVIRTKRDTDDHVRFSVKDVGIGLVSGTGERLFEPFYTTKGDGMGIGLYVSRSIVEGHSGRLWAASNDGPGATFAFSIPSYFRGGVSAGLAGDAKNAMSGQ
jgi:PAS domain S-box-containing protein